MKTSLLDKILAFVRKLIPKKVFRFFQPWYHGALAVSGTVIYGFPSRKLKVIGVTGTKGKSTTVFLISKILEAGGKKVAAIGSLGYKIGEREWPNTLKMTMPGRWKLQKFLHEAVRAGYEYVVLEVTSEGLKQNRHLGINFDCAVFTNLAKEHLESHGSFENYYKAKQKLFQATRGTHILNADDPNVKLFSNFSAKQKIFYGLSGGDIKANNISLNLESSYFVVGETEFKTHLAGEFNVYNCLAAITVAKLYGVSEQTAKSALEKIDFIPGRMEFIQREPFNVVVDYAHTPDSLLKVYQTLRSEVSSSKFQAPRLICVLGAAGGGRDKWKRPEFGKMAAEYCGEIILTDEDPYDEKPAQILSDIKSGIPNDQFPMTNLYEILDRKEAIKKALTLAKEGDTLVITGKGSETSIAIAGGQKIPWSDKAVVEELLKTLKTWAKTIR